jgi:hypothetical protein
MDGFRPVSRSGITLEVDQTARVNFELEVGAVAESIEVSADISASSASVWRLTGPSSKA